MSEADFREAIGSCVARCRKQAGFRTQAAFAEALGVSFRYVSRIELGRDNLSLSTIVKLTVAMQVPLADFLRQVAEELSGEGLGEGAG